jgi:hypothetical protein
MCTTPGFALVIGKTVGFVLGFCQRTNISMFFDHGYASSALFGESSSLRIARIAPNHRNSSVL